MTSSLVLTILIVFSFIVGRFLRRFKAPNFVFSGMLYLMVGLLLGPFPGFGVLSNQILDKLDPLISLFTGIAGCILGLRIRDLMRHNSLFITGLFSAALTFLVMFISFLLLNPYFLPNAQSLVQFIPMEIMGNKINPELQVNQLWFCFGIAATACSASLLSLGTESRNKNSHSEIATLLGHLTTSVQVAAIVLIGVCLASARATTSADHLDLSLSEWIVTSVLSGVLCGVLFSIFIGRQSNSDRILLAALGTLIFASGIGELLGISALFVCFTTGATISIFSSYSQPLREILGQLEEPIFVFLLILSGALWQPEFTMIWLLPLLYFLIRFAVFSVVPQFIYKRIGQKDVPRLGQGLLGQDLMAVAVALSFAHRFPDLAQMFLTTIFGSIFLNDFLASSLLKKIILDYEQKTEISPLKDPEVTP